MISSRLRSAFATPHDCYRELTCKQPVFDISRTVTRTGQWQAVLTVT